MAGARAAFEALAELFHRNVSGKSLGIHFLHGRREEIVDTEFFERGGILFKRTRIFGEIFGRTELCGIHEDRGNDRRTLPARFANEREMALVKRAHRGDEADDAFARASSARN